MIKISCKEYAANLKEELKEQCKTLERKPCLTVIQIGDDKASDSYVNGKRKDCEYVGIKFNHIHISDYENLDESDLCEIIKELDNSKEVDGIIVQLPILNKYNVKTLQQFISPEKDVDGFRKDSLYNPCTPQGIIDWLETNEIELRDQLVTVLGRSEIVGKPLANMLIEKGATVISCNSKTEKYHMKQFMKMSDIVVSAIGKPKEFDSFCFDIDTIIIDVGINRDENGKLCGDIDKEDIDDYFFGCCYVTPVPGGVGLLTRVTLLKNVMNSYVMTESRDCYGN